LLGRLPRRAAGYSNIRDEGAVEKDAVYAGLALDAEGQKHVLATVNRLG
jgi:transposase-like protein